MDVNGDGKGDLVERYTDGSGQVMLQPLLSTGSNFGLANPAPAPATADQDVNMTSVCDLNGDGKTDFLEVIGSGVAPRTVVAVLGTPSGLVSATRSFVTSYSDAADAIFVTDFDGDGKTDLLQYIRPTAGDTPHTFHLLRAR
jgi:FG-GAP-like repeat